MNKKTKSNRIFRYLLNAGKYIFVPLTLGWLTWKHLPDNTNILQQAATLASVSATLLGFIIAAVAVIVAVDNQVLIQNLKKYNYYESLIRSMMYSGLFMLLTTLSAFSIGFLPEECWQIRGMAICIMVVTIAFTFFISAARKLWLVLSTLANN